MAALLVHSLLGQSGVELAITCLSSLARTSVEEIAFVLHEDGTLSDDGAARLRDHLPVASLIRRRDADEQMQPLLRDYPCCAQYRRDQVLALKLFDVALFAGPEIYYSDTDVLFVAPHRGLFAGVLDRAQAAFMTDCGEYYALLPWHLRPFSGISLRSRINTGLFAFRRNSFDLGLIESFLAARRGSRHFRKRPMWIEQTAWSVLAAHTTCLAYDPAQFAIAGPSLAADSRETIAIHFVTSSRGLLAHYKTAPHAGNAPAEVRLRPAPMVRRLPWLRQELADFAGRRISRLRNR